MWHWCSIVLSKELFNPISAIFHIGPTNCFPVFYSGGLLQFRKLHVANSLCCNITWLHTRREFWYCYFLLNIDSGFSPHLELQCALLWSIWLSVVQGCGGLWTPFWELSGSEGESKWYQSKSWPHISCSTSMHCTSYVHLAPVSHNTQHWRHGQTEQSE